MNTNSDPTDGPGFKELADKLYSLEQRLDRLEALIRQSKVTAITVESEELKQQRSETEQENEERLESNFGEYGLAWLGNIVLFFGIIFLVEYLSRSGYVVISPLLGFAAVAGIFGFARYFRISNPYMAKIFNLNGYMLVYYVVLKLHFFAVNPIVAGKGVGLILVLAVIGILLFISFRTKYTLLAGLSLILLSVTAVVSDSTHMMLSLACLISILSILFLFRFGWIYLVYLSITLVYLISLLWLVGNPLMAHSLQIITNHQYGFNWIFLSAAVFSLIALMPARDESYSSDSIIGAVVYNGAGFVFTMGLCFLSFFKDTYALPAGSIAVYCMVYSIILKVHTNWKITAAIYALSGFVALSVAIFGIYGFPRSWTLLALQSLLVVSMAVWFKSRFVVIMNTLMYIMLLALYLLTSPSYDLANISFSLTALITARMLNWARDRISIRTVFIRNLYLVIAYFMVLYTLYHLIPRQYVTLSWSVAAVAYFLLSLLLKNVKYRYMALGTMVSAALFLLIVDLAYVELAYRVLALLFLAIISIGLSLYYNKKLKRKTEH
jgi:hypothetical protein